MIYFVLIMVMFAFSLSNLFLIHGLINKRKIIVLFSFLLSIFVIYLMIMIVKPIVDDRKWLIKYIIRNMYFDANCSKKYISDIVCNLKKRN